MAKKKPQSAINRFRSIVGKLISPVKNTMNLATEYLRFGSKSKMFPDWSNVEMSDQDWYKGYGYAAIRNRAAMVVGIATNNVRTDSDKDGFVHPYLEALYNSKTFSLTEFWRDASSFLDLEGIYYLMAVRADDGQRTGKVLEFKLLSPYQVRRVMKVDDKTGLWKVEGYVENRDGYTREIAPAMIIPIRDFNPFSWTEPYSLTDAAKEAQFTLRSGNDYTRNSLKGNINAPGILSTDIVLDDEKFAIFRQRIRDHTKGEPLFANGPGAMNWQDMQIDLSKAALKDTHEINREELLSVGGLSKTLMGIEQSGTTRETARVQKELSIEFQIIPRIQLIIDALNLDYKNHYPTQYGVTQAEIVVDNPLAVDLEALAKETANKTKQYELYKKLIQDGVDPEAAAAYVSGEADIDTVDIVLPKAADTTANMIDADRAKAETSKAVKNALDKQFSGSVEQQQGALQNEITNLDEHLVSIMLNRFERLAKKINATGDEPIVKLDSENDLITKTETNRAIKDLGFVLAGFYGIVTLLKGNQTMTDRMGEYAELGTKGTFKLNKDITQHIKELAGKVSESHVDTVVKDIYTTARDAALDGKSLVEIESLITDKYASVVVETRAKTIARTETNRAFTLAQFEADQQFLDQNGLEKRAYKKWQTRSSNPCPFCEQLAKEPPIPFNLNFRNLGGHVHAGDKDLPVNFEPLEAGNAHPNCSCEYVLIIE